jgi:penicillin-binding protein 2
MGLRQLTMLGAMFVALLVVFFRLWYLQVVKAAELTERADTFRWNAVPSLAPRGLIEDRKGNLLAGVKSELVITAIPDVVNRNPQVLPKLAQMLGTDEDKLKQKLANLKWQRFVPSPIFVGVPIEAATRVAESSNDLPGIDVQSQPVRYYPDGSTFAHVLGYVWTPGDHDVARLAKLGLRPSAYVGKTGLEYVYEKQLMGKAGTESVEVDARRRPIREVDRDNPTPGDKLVLTLDTDLQKIAMQELEAARADSPTSGGAVVALDPRTGEVLCLASNPTYNADLFLNGIKATDYDTLANDPMKPMFNRAIGGAYSPGSTFKIVSSLASAEAGVFNPTRTVFCPGYYEVGNRRSKCLGRHGSISFQDALEKSCNTYFSDLAIRTGPDILRGESTEVGLGQRSGIDLVGEGKAIVPTDAWLRAVRKLPAGEKPKWYPGDTVNMGIGQGELSVTPLQMADVAALVANQGTCYRPHVVRTITAASGGAAVQTVPEILWHTSVTGEIWGYLKNAMVQVIEHGTARRAQIPGIVWAGKTGSTEHSGSDKKTHSWFVGFAPADNPRIAIAVIVEQAGHGGEIAAPIAAKIVAKYLEEEGIKG